MLGAVACERAGMRMSARGHADERDDGRCGWAKGEGWDESAIARVGACE